MNNEMRQKYEHELARLDNEYLHYEEQWNKVHRFAFVALLAPIVGYFLGWGAGVVALLVSGALVGTRAYLIAMRKGEIRWNRERLVTDMQQDDPRPSLYPTHLRVSHA